MYNYIKYLKTHKFHAMYFKLAKEEKLAIAHILNKMARGGYWGRRLINEDDLVKYTKFSFGTTGLNKLLKILHNDGYLLFKKGIKGCDRYSLNPHLKNEIDTFIDEHMPPRLPVVRR